MKYSAMINVPGYMPDSEPAIFDTKEEALECLLHEVSMYWLDSDETIHTESAYLEAREHLTQHSYCYYMGYYFGVNEL